MNRRTQKQRAGFREQGNGLSTSLEVFPSALSPSGPDREAVTKMVRQALGPLLDDLQFGTRSAAEGHRLREIAIWAGDQSSAEAITQELVRLAMAAGKPAPPPSSDRLKAA